MNDNKEFWEKVRKKANGRKIAINGVPGKYQNAERIAEKLGGGESIFH